MSPLRDCLAVRLDVEPPRNALVVRLDELDVEGVRRLAAR
jgi:hypothetical protein